MLRQVTLFLLCCCWGIALWGQSVQEQKVVGYLPYYRFPVVDELQLDKLTHLCIAFANPDARGRLQTEGVDISPVVKQAHQEGLKVLISLAGGGMRAEWKAAWKQYMQPWNRPLLIQNIMQYVRAHQLDGVDVDLEWKDVDENYSPFVIALGKALKAEGKLLSLAVPAKHRYKHMSKAALRSADFINIMAYDLTGHWAPDRPGPHSPYLLAVSSLEYWSKQGLSRSQMVLGLPFYGWDFTDKRVRSKNYAEIVAENPAFAHRDQMGKVYYNGLTTVEAKTRLAMKKAGGVMIWEIGRDAFDPDYSLLSAIDRTINGERVPEEVVAQESLPEAVNKEKDKPVQAIRLRNDSLSEEAIESDFGEAPLAVNKDDRMLDVQIYPNPFKDSLTISNDEERLLQLTLTNREGRVLHQADLLPGSAISWDTGSFPHGYYTLSAVVSGKQQSKKLVKMMEPDPDQGVRSVLRNWTKD
jgi:GH18 family chitinase